MKKTNPSVFKNFSYLSLVQIITIIIPLLIYPYIIRIVGAEKYGEIVFIQAIMAYFQVLINYGFDLSGTKSVANRKDDVIYLSEIFTDILYLKLILSFLCFFLLLFFYKSQEISFFIIIFSFLASIFDCFIPIWFFSGMERMRSIVVVSGIGKLIYLTLIFLFIEVQSDYKLIPFLLFISTATSLLISLFILRFYFQIRFTKFNLENLRGRFNDGFIFLVSRLSSIINTKLAIMVIGSHFSMSTVAFYDLALKLVDIARMPINMLNQALYPRIVKLKKFTLVWKSILYLLFYSLIGYAFLYFFGTFFVIKFAGHKMLPALDILNILFVLVPISAVSYFLGNTVLIVLSKNRLFLLSVISGTICQVLFLYILYNSQNLTLTGITTSVIMSSSVVMILRLFFVLLIFYKKK